MSFFTFKKVTFWVYQCLMKNVTSLYLFSNPWIFGTKYSGMFSSSCRLILSQVNSSLPRPKASVLWRSLFRMWEVPPSKKQPFDQGVIVNPSSKSYWSMYDSLMHLSTWSSPFSWQTFSPLMKNHSAYDIQIMSVRETRYAISSIAYKSFLSRTMPWRVTFEVFCNAHAATLKFRNRVVCILRNPYLQIFGKRRPHKRLNQQTHELKVVEGTIARIFFSMSSKVKN